MNNAFRVELIDDEDTSRIHVHAGNRYSLNILLTYEGLIIDVWEPDFEGAEPLATCAIADNDWKDIEE